MARIEAIETRLKVWAQWVKTGDGSGYPTKCTLHPTWSPPKPGTLPTIKVSTPTTARQTHRAIAVLSERLRNTLVLHYVYNLSVIDQAARLRCHRDTVGKRIEVAHGLLKRLLDA